MYLPSLQNNLTKKALLVICIILSFSKLVNAQDSTLHLPNYDQKRLHIGFSLSINFTNFVVKPISNLHENFADTLQSVTSRADGGFNLGLIVAFKLCNHLKLVSVSDLGFAQRDLSYYFIGQNGIPYIVTKKIPSTFLNFPLDLKLYSNRFRHMDFYALAGGKYSLDLSSQRNVNDSLLGGKPVGLNRSDFAIEGGGGMEFYLPSFKFSIEGKLSMGLSNVLIKDASVYTQSLDNLKTKVFLISFLFGG